ncbi:non-ribosomal peptide synthetase family protein [Actinophytocola algeriensis]|uniref:Amino acid adenylation domain-containing protein/thioester reductase-like protein n=1 Tax=Actinophytocola algeriensis TaxID=1768010 RepID=A0A7W7VGH7_9PSEU|nr:non-ribosomal peptide synthetase [Actinophytocola algeriensis]MBB4909432.1 amino acid adenylation domain-containing protein/thioester reductase-like protein [Actinophytocola algeriensis]MBE1475422.1 amino acid adenylation domain-containing protein/thioester reductase-like protein [Actinophytocola algeriensis]
MNIRRQPNVHELFAARAAQRPDGIAVVSGDQQVTYAELAARAFRLANFLRHNGTGPESVVMVHLERSIDTIVAVLGILAAGGTYLPVEPGVPDSRIRGFARETGCTTVITQAKDAHRFTTFAELVVTAAAGDAGGYPAAPPEVFVSASDAAYVIYTSGSTGTPKGVVVHHAALSYVITELVDWYGITPDDRVLQFGALSFDTSIEQIMVALTAGAALVLPDLAWAPSELPDRLRAHGVTVMDLTPAYWRRFLTEYAARPVELPVRLSIVGGEAVLAEDCRTALELLPGVRLVNAYGLTETTITSCVVDLTADILPPRGAAPVGPPLPGTTVHVLDEELRPVPDGERGEICIGGRGVARYLSADARARERYVPDPFSDGRLYRTGDLGAWTPDGNLEVVGRIDRQLKIRGFRVEPGEVEATLAAHELVGNVAVTDYEQHGQRRLAAYYTVPPGASLDAKELRDFAAGFLPDYLVPSAFVALPELPLKANGKVDLTALPAPVVTEGSEEDGSTVVSLFERGVARLWCQVLERDRVGPHDNFFALGGNSILAAELLAKVRGTFGVMITQVRPLIRLLLEDASLRSFAFAVQAARAGTLPGDDTRKRVDFAAESELDVPISASVPDAPSWRAPEHVFLTGATGFLGTYLLRELLSTTDAVVHCLVRADGADEAMARLQSTAVHYHGDDLAEYRIAGRIVAVPGDLAAPGLGLSEADFDRLARTADVIHHPGGLVNFIYPYSHMRPANVEGTREIIRMAARYRNIPVHYTSTMAVVAGFGTAGVRHVTETTPLAHADHLSVGYVESKWVAEALLLKAAEQGLPVAIYRAADISGDRVTGAWNTATEMCAMKKFVVDTGTAPVAELPLDYTPVDVFAAAVAHIAATSLPRGDVYHLTNPGKVNIAELVARMRARGHEIREVSWQEWLDELVTLAVENPEHPMTPFAPLFIDRCATGEMSVAEMYLEDTFPEFSRTNVENALRGSGIVIPPVDAAMLDSYLDYLTDIDFLRAA